MSKEITETGTTSGGITPVVSVLPFSEFNQSEIDSESILRRTKSELRTIPLDKLKSGETTELFTENNIEKLRTLKPFKDTDILSESSKLICFYDSEGINKLVNKYSNITTGDAEHSIIIEY